MNIEELKKKALEQACSSVGYSESENKPDFKKGVKLAIDKSFEMLLPEILLRDQSCQMLYDCTEAYKKELGTIAGILRKY